MDTINNLKVEMCNVFKNELLKDGFTDNFKNVRIRQYNPREKLMMVCDYVICMKNSF